MSAEEGQICDLPHSLLSALSLTPPCAAPMTAETSAEERHIGDLPPHVLTHILSFLPTIDAVKTAFVSRSWRGLWADLPHLDLDAKNFFTQSQPPELDESGGLVDAAAARFAGFLDWVLRRRFDPRRPALRCLRLRLLLYSDHGAELLRPLLDDWVHLAMSGGVGVESLDLKFMWKRWEEISEDDRYVLEGARVGAAHSSLVSLSLKRCKLVAAGFGSFGSLKSLVLSDVSFPSGAATEMVSKCPLLEELRMLGCLVRGSLAITGPSSRLRSLELAGCIDDDFGTFSFQICAPELSRFKFYGILQAICSVRDLSHHPIDVEVKAFGTPGSEPEATTIVELLKDFSSATSLSLSTFCVEVLLIANNTLNCLPNLKRLRLSLSICMHEYPGVTHLLRSSCNLESLSIDIWRRGHEYQLEGDYWGSQNLPIHCLVNHLKRVEINKYMGLKNQLNFVAFLLKNSVVLEEMRITTSLKMLAQNEHIRNFSQILSSLPRASHKVAILVECIKKSCPVH